MISKDQSKHNNLNILDGSRTFVDDKNQTIQKLKELLPNVINSDNQLDTRALQDVLDIANTTSNNQGYELTFAGKGIAKSKADEPTTKELEADLEQSKYFDATENVVIRGDNIDTLKILKANYTNKIKMIYIDPPYNTKSENFVYNDNFKKSEAELIKEFGLADETQNFLSNVYGTRSHSGWLSFMYPRLKIARELLKDDGVIFISIDDNEQANLKIMCDEIFDQENFFGTVTWNNRSKPKNIGGAKYSLQSNTEFILVYGKIPMDRYNFKLPEVEQIKYPETDENGSYRLVKVEQRKNKGSMKRDNMVYPLLGIELKDGYRWQLSKEKRNDYIKNNRLIKKGNKILVKVYASDEEGFTYEPFWSHRVDTGTAEKAKEELEVLLGHDEVFDTVKPTLLLTQLLSFIESDALILDFFAGSGTTGDAVMQLNREDGGARKYILAQWDEQIDPIKKKEAYDFCKGNGSKPVISSITIERLNRAGEKIKADVIAELEAEQAKEKPNQEKLAELEQKLENAQNLDIGYKVFSLKDKPCITDVTNDGGQVSFVPQNLREKTLDTLANMLCATCKPLHKKIETLITDKLYKADNEIYLLGSVDKSELDKYKDLKINVDGYSNLDLEHFLNLGITDKDNVSVVY